MNDSFMPSLKLATLVSLYYAEGWYDGTRNRYRTLNYAPIDAHGHVIVLGRGLDVRRANGRKLALFAYENGRADALAGKPLYVQGE